MRRIVVLSLCATLVAATGARGGGRTVALPPPATEGRLGVEAALAARRSVRTYSPRRLSLAEVGQLMWAAQGVSGPDGKRTAPSAMHRYPLEIAVVAQAVDGLARGAYRYLPASHSLELLVEAGRGPMLAGATSQASVQSAPAVFVVAAVYDRMTSGANNRTWTDYEAGLASENLLLQAVALGLGGVVVGGIDRAAVKEAVKFSGGEQVIVVIPVGQPEK